MVRQGRTGRMGARQRTRIDSSRGCPRDDLHEHIDATHDIPDNYPVLKAAMTPASDVSGFVGPRGIQRTRLSIVEG